MTKYIDGQFGDCGPPLCGVDYQSKSIDIDGNKVLIGLWNTAGQERFKPIIKPYCKNSHCAIIVFDLTNEYSVNDAIDRFYDIFELNGILPVVFLGNKSDLEHKEINDISKLKGLEKRYKTKYFEVSAKNDNGIIESVINGVLKEAFYQFIYDNEILNGDAKSRSINTENNDTKEYPKC